MHKAIGTVVMRAKSEGISKGLLLVCKRTRFGGQKDSFWCVKGLLLEGKRTTFEKAIKKTAKTCVALIYYCIFAIDRQLFSMRDNSIIKET